MLLILLPTLYRRLHNKEKLFMAMGGVWTLASVAVSRLTYGRCIFLSDVSVSSLLTIALGAVAVWLFYILQAPSSTKSGPSPPAIQTGTSSGPRKNRNTFR